MIPIAAQSSAGVLMSLQSPSEVSNLEKATERETIDKLAAFVEEHPQYNWGWETSNWSLPSIGNYYKFDGRSDWFRDSEDYVRFVEPMMLRRATGIWDLYNTQDKRRARQASLVELISFPSPAFHLRKSLSALAATDHNVYVHFLDAIRRYHRQMIADFERRGYFTDNALQFFCRRDKSETTDEGFSQRYAYYQQQFDSGKRYEEFIGLNNWGELPPEQIPPFSYENSEPNFAAAIQPMSMLAVMLAIAVVIGFVAFNRYDVR